MSRASRCEWSWMTDALDDGRLGAEQQTNLRRHAHTCKSCRQALAGLARVREVMNALPEPTVTDFHHRRERQNLLARAGGEVFARSAERSPRRWVWIPLSISALALAVGFGTRIRRELGPSRASGAPQYDVTGLEEASWVNRESGGTAVVTLARGSAAFHVHHLEAGQRFLVALPDGEVEVRGTRFVVNVDGQSTRYVVVMDGKVALRTHGQPERILIAGQRWDAPPSVAPAPVPVAAAPTLPEPRGRSIAALAPIARLAPQRPVASAPAESTSASSRAPKSAPNVAARGPRAPEVELTPPQTSAAPTLPFPTRAPSEDRTAVEASELFARGVTALRAARYGEADVLLQEFLARHPRDSRAEDAAFLRAVGRSRSGDVANAAKLAREYLARFPQGMRRREAESLTRLAPP